MSMAIMVLLLGSSAGLALYTKRTGSMLQRMKQQDAVKFIRQPPKYGPMTKQEAEKMKPRIDDDDF